MLLALPIGPLVLPLLHSGNTLAADEMLAGFYAELSLRSPTASLAVVCHGFACQYRDEISFTSRDHARLGEIMAAGRTAPALERQAIAEAVRWFDLRIGPAAGTTHRIARAGPYESGDPGQMDCIDISANNTSLFLVLDRLHLLRHHRVEPPVSRGILIDLRLPHTTAVLAEIRTGQEWAFDNWTRDYGELPEVQPLEQWKTGRD